MHGVKRLLSAIVLLAALSPSQGTALEFGFTRFSINAGYIENFHRDDPAYDDTYSFYPELQAGGAFLFPYLTWIGYWGYWDDRAAKPVRPSVVPVFSFKSHIAGVRVMFNPRKTSDNWPLPAGLFAGISRHFVTAEYLGDNAGTGIPPKDYHRNSNTLEFGLNIEFPLWGLFSLRGEVHQFFPFTGDDFEELQKNRRAYTLGISAVL
jgi:hypothetical protein